MSYTIGIPRALLYYKYYPMWSTFLRELGANVVISDPTDYQIINSGTSRVISDTCLPLKVFIGHVISLVSRCDFILIPVLRSTHKKVLNCSRFLGLPDVVRAAVPESPPILEIEFDMNRGRVFLYRQILDLGRKFTDDPIDIMIAAKIAWETHRNYLEMMADLKITCSEAIALLEKVHSNKVVTTGQNNARENIHIGLIGHPYMLDDENANQHIQKALKKYGVTITTPVMLTADELKQGFTYMNTRAYWVAEDEVVGAGGYYIRSGADGIIGVMAFGCGPDSLMMHLVERKARSQNIPYMCLTLDEHTAETGIVTRLEAYLDMIGRRLVKRSSDAYYLPPYR